MTYQDFLNPFFELFDGDIEKMKDFVSKKLDCHTTYLDKYSNKNQKWTFYSKTLKRFVKRLKFIQILLRKYKSNSVWSHTKNESANYLLFPKIHDWIEDVEKKIDSGILNKKYELESDHWVENIIKTFQIHCILNATNTPFYDNNHYRVMLSKKQWEVLCNNQSMPPVIKALKELKANWESFKFCFMVWQTIEWNCPTIEWMVRDLEKNDKKFKKWIGEKRSDEISRINLN